MSPQVDVCCYVFFLNLDLRWILTFYAHHSPRQSRQMM
jgi:hypothetical protein